jgi:hypothetical protein
MENLNLGTPTNINGLLFGEEGKITAFSLCSTSLMEVICHGKSEHYVTFQGGFHAGKGSYSNLGIALGKNAIVTDGDGIQLGSGTNSDPNTLQVYDFKLLDNEGKIPQDRLPNLTIELAVIGNDLSWRYVGETTWIPILDITNLQGVDGQSFEVSEYGILNEAKIIEITNSVITGRYLFLVNPLGDIRVDNTTPTALNGDMSRHILMYDGDDQEWFDYGEFTGLQGEPGIPIELQNNGTYIQWKYTTSPTWTNIITLTDLKGDKGDIGDSGLDGKNIELDGTDVNYIRWRNVGDTTWINLINKSTITGPKGISGDDGRDVEFRVYSNRWLQWRYVGEIAWNNSYDFNLLSIVDNNWTLVEGILSPTVPTTRIRTSVIATDDNDVVNKKYVDDKESRDFSANPIDLESEITGILPISNIAEGFLKLDQSTKQTLTSSPIIADLTAGSLLIAGADKSVKSLIGIDYNVNTKKAVFDGTIETKNNINIPQATYDNPNKGIYIDGRQFLYSYKYGKTNPQGIDLVFSNLFIGDFSGNRTAGHNGTYVAHGMANTGIGDYTLQYLNDGMENFALGQYSLNRVTNGGRNCAMGRQSGGLLTTGSDNLFLGSSAGYGLTTQNRNTIVGSVSGRYTVNNATNNFSEKGVYIGAWIRVKDAPSATNEIIIGAEANGNGSNSVTLGNDNITKTFLKGDVKITGSVQIGDRQTTASEELKGTTRYREGDGYSVTEMCMQISETEYAWKEQVRNEW